MVASRRGFISGASPLRWLLTINISLYVLSVVVGVGFYLIGRWGLFEFYFRKLALSGNLHTLLTQPWSIVTHMFLHDVRGIWHVLMNMLWLYWMGQLFCTTQPAIRLYWAYGLGGIAGAIGFLAYAGSHAPYNGYAIGASAAVNGVFFATVMLMPHLPVFLLFIGPIALRWLALIWIFLDLILTLNGNEASAVAHLSGAGMGVLLGYLLKQGWAPENLLRQLSFSFTSEEITPEEVDRILDKINQKGLKSLTRRERNILRRAAEKL
ncbi:MAG: rhomboid family intramembrane serine protease [Bacteroidia bacterium]|nr:rhomboid family intramembrane serine protease [Bacteroidia bacterium]GIV22818.1 MAG: rhomboid family intramembrane serine protease [Bacteroidia bacterium]